MHNPFIVLMNYLMFKAVTDVYVYMCIYKSEYKCLWSKEINVKLQVIFILQALKCKLAIYTVLLQLQVAESPDMWEKAYCGMILWVCV